MEEYQVVGKSLTRVDARVKTTGEARFVVDLVLSGMLYGKILRSSYAHARILNIDTSLAKRLPGVKAVITGRDIGDVRFAFVDTPRYPADENPIALEKVRYVGEEVAAVAAIDEDTADEALDLIRVEYEPLPAVFDPEESMKEGAPRIHDDIIPNTSTAWEDWGVSRKARTFRVINNVCATTTISYGDVEKGFRESDYIREDRFRIPATAHAAMEPHVALASFNHSTGDLDIWLSHMGYEIKRYWLAKTLKMPLTKVKVHRAYVGGAFGGKVNIYPYEFIAAFLSRKTCRPVKIELTREEVFATTRSSHRMIIDVKTGVKRDGTLMAQEIKVINDPGAYRGSSPVAMFLAHAFSSPIYNVPNLRYDGVGVYTNKSVCMAKRGHGSPQARFAIESQMDMIARHLGIDAGELRLKNLRKRGDVLPNGDRLDSYGLPECVREAVKASDWGEKKGKGKKPSLGIGMGLAAMFSGSAYYPFTAAAFVKLELDGRATLFTGNVEFGQGSDTVMPQIAAEELGLSLEDIILVANDSELCPADYGNWLSGGVYVSGEAVRRAAANAKLQLLENAAEMLQAKVEELMTEKGYIYAKEMPGKKLPFSEIVRDSIQRNGNPIVGVGYCKPVPEIEFYPSISKGVGRFTNAYGFTAAIAEVEVNKETGKVRVFKITLADDCGFAINPLSVEGQLESQAVMGVGDALFEEVTIDNQGRMVTTSFLDYKIPGTLDTPEIESIHVNSLEPKGPFGAKEVGECARAAVIAAIANAVCDAIGARIYSLPITPEKILEALKSKKE